MTVSNFLGFTTNQKFLNKEQVVKSDISYCTTNLAKHALLFIYQVSNGKVWLAQFQSNLKPRHCAALVLGLPILIFSMVSSEPVLAGSEFIALMIMMFDRQLSGLVEWLNGQIKIWQVITVISIATILLAQLINPVNAISSTTPASESNFDQPGFAVASIKLAIVSLNLLVMAVILFALRLLKSFWLKITSKHF